MTVSMASFMAFRPMAMPTRCSITKTCLRIPTNRPAMRIGSGRRFRGRKPGRSWTVKWLFSIDQITGCGVVCSSEPPGYVAWEWWVRFHAKGLWPFSAQMEPQIASDAGVEALEEMIRATEHLCPETSQLGLFANWERYSRGDIYCNIGWGGSQKYLNGHPPSGKSSSACCRRFAHRSSLKQ